MKKTHISPSIFFFSVALFGFFVMLQPWLGLKTLSFFDQQRWLEVFVLAAIAPLALSYSRLIRLSPWLLMALLLVPLSALVNQEGAVLVLRLALWLIVFAMAPLFFAQLGDRTKKIGFFIFLVTIALYCVYTIVGFFVFLFLGKIEKTYLVTSFSNINHAAGTYLLLILVLPALAGIFISSKKLSLLTFLTMSWLTFMLLVVGSRGALLAFFAVLFCVFFIKSLDSAFYGKLLLKVMSFALALYAMVFPFLGGLEKKESTKAWYSDSGRFEIYKKAILGGLDKPLLGHGPLSFSAVDGIAVAHAHNIVLNTFYEFGFLFIFCASVYLMRFLRFGVSSLTEKSLSLVEICGLSVLVGFFIHSQFSGLTMIPTTLLVVMLGVSMLSRSFSYNAIVYGSFSKNQFFVGLALSFSYFFLVWLSWLEVKGGIAIAPRFWLLSH